MTGLYRNIIARRYILVALVSALALTSCDNEESISTDAGNYPTFSATIEDSASRAYDSVWEDGDKIGIYYGDVVNISHTHQGNGNFTVTDPDNQIVFADDSQVRFYAYYPYSTPATSGTNKGKIAFTSNLDQTKQKTFDFLWASADGSKAAPDVLFKFTHRMSRISVIFRAGEDMDLSLITAYSIGGLFQKGTFDPLSGECKTTTSSTLTSTATINLTGVEVKEDVMMPSVITFPQKLKNNPITITVTAAGANAGTITGSLYFENGTLEPGNNYLFVIRVSKTALTVESSSIIDWAISDQGDSWQAW